MFDTILFLLGLSLTLTKGAFQALAVIYPSYKTWKALESRSLKASQSMLLYWCITAFVSAIKEFADQLLGNYANFIVWKLLVLTLKAAPLLIGPDRMYAALVKPLFESQEQNVDAVVDEVHKVREIAKEAVPALKEGDVGAAKEKAGEIVDQIKSSDLVHSIQEQAIELSKSIEAKSAEYGFAWDRAGLMGVLEQIISQFEGVRDSSVSIASDQWQQHGPFVLKQTATLRGKATEYAPLVKSKAVDVWSSQLAPRVQPLISAGQQKYTETIKPAVLARTDQIQQLWIKYGGPVRRVYTGQVRPILRNQVQPFLRNTLLPFLRDSFLPQVYETLIVLKEKIVDIIQTPSEETKAGRAHHKRRRADARKERLKANKPLFQSAEPTEGQLYKRQKTTNLSDDSAADLAAAQQEANLSADKSTTSADIDRSEGEGMTSHPQASLRNRKTKELQDSSLEKALEKPQLKEDLVEIADKSDLHADAPAFEPKNVSIGVAGADKTIERAGSGEKLGDWGNEPRTTLNHNIE
jgi:hypothetical protein